MKSQVPSIILAVTSVLLSNVAGAQDIDVPGNLTMTNSTEAQGNILKDGVPFIHNFGSNNTFVGSNAGNLAMSGSGNTGAGVSALESNTTGYANTSAGFSALRSNTTGIGNTAFGANALQSNTTAFGNTGIGAAALLGNTTGFGNTALGQAALLNNTTGDANTASGFGALNQNTTGFSNTADGFNALALNRTGALNVASGQSALRYNTDGSGNSAHGAVALQLNTTGSGNTASGHLALQRNSTGNNNTACGLRALWDNTTGDENTAVGNFALRNNTTGSFNTAIGSGADVPFTSLLTNATAIGAGAIVDGSNKIRLGNTDVTVIEGQVPFTFTSDVNQKENFQPVDGEEVLSKVQGMSITSWNYIGQDTKQFRHYGPMAQDFFATFGNDGVGTIGTPTTINSGDMAGVTLVAAQALEKRTAEQKKELAALKAENADLKARLEALERMQQGRGVR